MGGFFFSKQQQWQYIELRMLDTVLLNMITRIWKIVVSASLGFFCFGFSVYHEFFVLYDGDESIIFVTDGIAFSVVSMLANCHWILGLFLLKQALNTWRRSKEQKAVMIKITPVLSWKEA